MAWPTSLSGCRRGRLLIELRVWLDREVLLRVLRGMSEGMSNEHALGRDSRDAGQGHPAGVALERRAEFHAIFFAASGGDLRILVRSAGGGVSAHRRRTGLGCVFVCGGGGAQPDLGA